MVGTVGDPPKRRVTAIILDSSGGTPTAPRPLKGEVPAALAALKGLETVNFHYNALSGPIPPELGDLPNLKTLDLSGNRLSNPFTYGSLGSRLEEPGIPSELGRLKATLQSLDLSGNNLGGDIPSAIWDLTELTSLRLHGNHNINHGPGLTGTIPPEIKNLTKLQGLALHGNRFSGVSRRKSHYSRS